MARVRIPKGQGQAADSGPHRVGPLSRLAPSRLGRWTVVPPRRTVGCPGDGGRSRALVAGEAEAERYRDWAVSRLGRADGMSLRR